MDMPKRRDKLMIRGEFVIFGTEQGVSIHPQWHWNSANLTEKDEQESVDTMTAMIRAAFKSAREHMALNIGDRR